MIEWGNNWAKAINYRRNNDEPFAGYFSQIGRLYNVHHIWCKLKTLCTYYYIILHYLSVLNVTLSSICHLSIFVLIDYVDLHF